ncbi:MAG: hypothetical protein Q9224_001241 [Gallowayella concinna]
MDNQESLDRSSLDIGRHVPVTGGHESYNPNVDYVGAGTLQQQVPNTAENESFGVVDAVLQSDEFAAFLKKRSTLEEEHAQGLKKLCKGSHEFSRRPDNRQGSYAQHYDEVIGIHDRLADNGVQFGLSIHQMHEDLHDLAANIERGRKQWKQTGLSAEKRVQDSEALMEKAKAKYDSLAEDYDRARTGDKQSGRVFGLKGPKSAVQHEEDVHRKMQAADADYASKVQTAQSQRQELVSTQRPQAVKAILDLINECDAGLTLQLQKYASFNEKLLLGNGLCVSPLKGHNNDRSPRSLRDVVFQIDNTQDLNSYIRSFSAKAGQRSADIKYQPHSSLGPSNHPIPADPRSQFDIGNPPNPPGTFPITPFSENAQFSETTPNQRSEPDPFPVQNPGDQAYHRSPHQQTFPPSGGAVGPLQLPQPQLSSALYSQPPTSAAVVNPELTHHELPPLRPVFGVSLEDLLNRDGSAIPLVVYQCLQAVDLFGLDVEGIYRLSGSTMHISKLRAIFESGMPLLPQRGEQHLNKDCIDPSQVDFRNPESFFHDVNSVAGLLKQFFRDLPDPLLTHQHFQNFIEAARIDDDVTRRDSLHAIVNSLPDPNYATLRAVTLHLHRVQEHSAANRMNAGNLAICFGPTLMGTGSNIADNGWQVKVIETILHNTYQIFDDD